MPIKATRRGWLRSLTFFLLNFYLFSDIGVEISGEGRLVSGDIMAQLGGSLLVPSVQEMAKEPITTVPSRYVRLDQDPPLGSSSTALPEAPVIDLQRLSTDGLMDKELERLHQACKEWGFFQLINHGVHTSPVEKVKVEIQEFFNMPMEEKKQYWQKPGDLEGFGQAFVVSEEQKLDWADMFYMITLPTHLRKPHLFPKLPLPLRETLEVYSAELRSLALKLLYCMAKALRMNPNDITELFEEGWQGMRMNYYPPCPQPELVMGLNAHSDPSGLTILLQLNEMEGLQIKKDGQWLPLNPLPNAFVINIGDNLEIVTNAAYHSIEHRATVNSVKERLSIATFYGPKMDGEIGPAPSLITPETPPLFRRISVVDFLKAFLTHELNGKSRMDVVRIQNEEDNTNI